MEFVIPPPEIVPSGLRALKVVALANGEFAQRERALLDAAQKMFGTNHDLDALAPISPKQLAAAVTSPALRRQLVYAMLVLSMADGEASPEEAEQVESFRDALDVDAHEVKTFRNLAEGHLMTARFDVIRRFWVGEHVLKKAREGGLKWVAKAIAAVTGIAADGALAAKYRALESYPEGTLGRAYIQFVNDNQFSVPGEKGSPPEPIVMHDLTHVVSGYGTDPSSEICVTAFHAGYRRKEPFTFLLFSMMQFNMGIAVTPITPGTSLQFDPPRVLQALRRGAAMTADLTDGSWDYWADMALPLEQVRARYGIPPLEPQ